MRPSRRSGRGWEALPEGLMWSGGPPGGLGGVVKPSSRSGRPSQRSGKGQVALP